jgi:hypothetical protein
MLEAAREATSGPEPDPFECVVLDVKARAPGFYTAAWRTYYVAGAGTVYLLRAPGQRATLLQLDDLPDGRRPGLERRARPGAASTSPMPSRRWPASGRQHPEGRA